MQRLLFCLACVTVIFLSTSLAFSERSGEQHRGALGILSKGQSVSLKESGDRYVITIFADKPETLPNKVVEVGGDYVVVQDIVGVQECRIPIYAVKSVNIIRAAAPR